MQEYLVTPLFKSVKGVEDVIGWGGDEKQYDIVIDSKKLQNVNITYNDIVLAIQKSNQVAGGQYLEFNKEQYLIRGIGLYKTLDDIRKTVIKSENNQPITIEDIVYRDWETDRKSTRLNSSHITRSRMPSSA